VLATSATDRPASTRFRAVHADRNLVLDAWYSGGRQVIDVAELASPRQAGWFSPTPLARSSDQVVVWSFPIVSQCLVDVVDIRKRVIVLRKVTR
jgi:hypothetical protein